MKFFIATVAIIASFSVHANESYGSYDDDPNKSFNASSISYETMKITWKRVDKNKVLSECNSIRKKYNLSPSSTLLDGCTIWHYDECIIVTEKSTTMHTIGHEVRHCYQRNWH